MIFHRMRPFTLAFAFAATLAAAATAPADTIYYVAGHADMGVGYEEGGAEFDMHYHFVNSSRFAVGDPLGPSRTLSQWNAAGVPISAESSPGSIVTYVGAPTAVADAAAASYLGVAAGSEYYILPALQQAAKPWLGFGSEELDDFVDSQGNPIFTSALTWKLDAVTGGDVAVWDANGAKWSTALGATSFSADVGHAHTNWGFSNAGLYTLTVTVSGFNAELGRTIRGTGTYTFQVGTPSAAPVPEPSALAMAGLAAGLGAVAAARRRRA